MVMYRSFNVKSGKRRSERCTYVAIPLLRNTYNSKTLRLAGGTAMGTQEQATPEDDRPGTRPDKILDDIEDDQYGRVSKFFTFAVLE
jgi:hypothetical protein